MLVHRFAFARGLGQQLKAALRRVLGADYGTECNLPGWARFSSFRMDMEEACQ
jgi:hypothetical protein